jgi:seryl-tRNA synthetase
MPATDYDIAKFYDGLVAHGLIFPTPVPGTFGRSAVFEDVLERFNRLVDASAVDDHAEAVMFPPIIDRQILEQVEYLDSFPQLAGVVHSFLGKELRARELSARIAAGQPWSEFMEQTAVAMTPAACYPVYPMVAGRGVLPSGGRTISLTGWVFRHEPSEEPTRMQSFRCRELIRVGSPDDVAAWRDAWLARGMALLEGLGLPVVSDVAADPFFGRGGRMMAANQKDMKLKFEVLCPVISIADPTAICSFNFHQDKFATKYGIKTADGETASTACLGFGLERCVMALFQHHGFDPALWSADVRKRLWL